MHTRPGPRLSQQHSLEARSLREARSVASQTRGGTGRWPGRRGSSHCPARTEFQFARQRGLGLVVVTVTSVFTTSELYPGK